MENIEKCECVIGIRYDYEDTDIITLSGLKEHIESEKRFAERHKDDEWLQSMYNKYTLEDYCDRRKSTDLKRFNYCPLCGKKIDWKAINGGTKPCP